MCDYHFWGTWALQTNWDKSSWIWPSLPKWIQRESIKKATTLKINSYWKNQGWDFGSVFWGIFSFFFKPDPSGNELMFKDCSHALIFTQGVTTTLSHFYSSEVKYCQQVHMENRPLPCDSSIYSEFIQAKLSSYLDFFSSKKHVVLSALIQKHLRFSFLLYTCQLN